MRKPEFDSLLDYLCSGIHSADERQSVRDELYDHLMCLYEKNTAVGMDEEAAAKEAMNTLGNADELRHELSLVHSYSPNESMNRAVALLIAGFVFSSFQLNFFSGMETLWKLLGAVLTLCGLFSLRKANKMLKYAMITDCFACAAAAVSFAVYPLLYEYSAWVVGCACVRLALGLATWLLTLKGLSELTSPYKAFAKKPLRYSLVGGLNILSSIVSGTLIVLTNGSRLNISGGDTAVTAVIFSVTLALILSALVLLIRVYKLLNICGHEYRVESSGKKQVAVIVAAVLLFFAVGAGADMYSSLREAEEKPYTVNDAGMAKSEYNRICGLMREYGVRLDVINSLPESELANYADIEDPAAFDFDELQSLIESNRTANTATLGSRTVTGNCFMIPLKNYDVRILRYYELTAADDRLADITGCIDHFIINQPELMPLSCGGEHNGDFLLLLKGFSGTETEYEPLAIHGGNNSLVDSIYTVDFREKCPMRLFHAATYSFYGSDSVYISSGFIRRSSPLLGIGERTAAEIEQKSSVIDSPFYSRAHVDSVTWLPQPLSAENEEDSFTN